ncbi:hypothetical protein CC78DRAFT_201667 [Lojkania enalia]|uniref:Uncharacterized protein n=1 Tax=Lojkania enalia TaxID=147567 RepID=A0A9P4JV21_9PLEO|nr:hypothetical protein CC78DRAFT_201667 [Didymosphaeria enalia]
MVCVIEANSDVTGTGIRASIYTLSLASGVLTTIIKPIAEQGVRSDFLRALDAALQVQGLALLCTAIYQTIRTQLTLFHAICVLHLLSLLGVGLTAWGKYGHKGRVRRFVLWGIKAILSAAFIAFVSYIWITAPKFGRQPECNASTKYVVFFVSIDATNDVFRYTIMALMISTLVAAVFGFMIIGAFSAVFAAFFGIHKKSRLVEKADVEMAKNIFSRITVKDGQLPVNNTWTWMPNQHDVGYMFARTLINLYMILMLELTISRNDLGEDEKRWTFGQIIAIFLLLGVAAEVCNIILAQIDSKLDKKAEEELELEQKNVRQPLQIQESGDHSEDEGNGPGCPNR